MQESRLKAFSPTCFSIQSCAKKKKHLLTVLMNEESYWNSLCSPGWESRHPLGRHRVSIIIIIIIPTCPSHRHPQNNNFFILHHGLDQEGAVVESRLCTYYPSIFGLPECSIRRSRAWEMESVGAEQWQEEGLRWNSRSESILSTKFKVALSLEMN